MKKRVHFILSLVVLFTISVLAQNGLGASKEEDKLIQQMNELKKKQEQIQGKAKTVASKLNTILKDQKDVKNQIYYLDLQMNELQKEIDLINEEIAVTEKRLTEEAQKLDAAIQRVEERDKLLKTRVKAMYVTGDASYLELLLDSKSIGDFLSRKDYVEKIVDSDKTILAENIADKEEIAERKAQIEKDLTILEGQYAEASMKKQDLEAKAKERTLTLATLQSEEDEYEKEKELLDNELKKLANELSKLNKELMKIRWDGGKLMWPVPDSHTITSKFGLRVHPIKKTKSNHSGIDIGAKSGSKIVAAEAGKVIMTEYYGAYGNTVMIDHGGLVTMYSHIRNGGIKVKEGQMVERGQKIAEVGSTGLSTGPHLHFSVLKDGEYVNPMNYLGK